MFTKWSTEHGRPIFVIRAYKIGEKCRFCKSTRWKVIYDVTMHLAKTFTPPNFAIRLNARKKWFVVRGKWVIFLFENSDVAYDYA